MANIKTYNVLHAPTFGEIKVEIDFDYEFFYGETKMTVSGIIKEMAEFWAHSDSRLKENGNDPLKTFLKHLCQTALALQYEKDYNLSGVISEFENKEGWCSMNGDSGIKIISIYPIIMDNQEDFEVTEFADHKSLSNN